MALPSISPVSCLFSAERLCLDSAQPACCVLVQLLILASLPAPSTRLAFLTLDSWLMLSPDATFLIDPVTLYPTHLPTVILPSPSAQLSAGLGTLRWPSSPPLKFSLLPNLMAREFLHHGY